VVRATSFCAPPYEAAIPNPVGSVAGRYGGFCLLIGGWVALLIEICIWFWKYDQWRALFGWSLGFGIAGWWALRVCLVSLSADGEWDARAALLAGVKALAGGCCRAGSVAWWFTGDGLDGDDGWVLGERSRVGSAAAFRGCGGWMNLRV
jgi:hypothetical protein